MSKMIEKCDVIVEQIEEIVTLLLTTSHMHTQLKFATMLQNWMEIYPVMIQIYQRPEFSDVSDDYMYWSNQFERIIQANNKGDTFLLIDALYFEARENLIIFRSMVSESLEGGSL